MRFVSLFALSLATLLAGCNDTTAVLAPSSPWSPPAAPVQSNKQNASAIASAIVGAGSIPARTLDDATSGVPTFDHDNPNAIGFVTALAVTLRGPLALTSPLGGTCDVSDAGATFHNWRVPTGTLNGTLQVLSTSGTPAAGHFTANLQFLGLTYADQGRQWTLQGPASLTASTLNQSLQVGWDSSVSARESSTGRSVLFQHFVNQETIQGSTVSETLQGTLQLQSLNGLDGVLAVETPRAFTFAAANGTLQSKAGTLLIHASEDLQILANPLLPNTVTVTRAGAPARVLSWSYLGGSNRLLPALRPVVADTVLTNANVLTLDDANPSANAVAIRDGRLLRVGSSAEALALQDSNTEVVDLQGKTLLPGFIEPHMHYDVTALHLCAEQQGSIPANPLLIECGLYDLHNPARSERTQQQTLDALSAAASAHPEAAGIFGFNYDPSRLQAADLFKNLTLAQLDAVSPTIPVAVQNASGHISYANSAAFRLATVTVGNQTRPLWPTAPLPPYTPPVGAPFDPADIVVDPSTGLPTGQLNEDAQLPIAAAVLPGALGVRPGQRFATLENLPPNLVRWLANWRTMQDRLAQQGVTSAVDILMGANTALSLELEAAVTAELESRPDCPTRALCYVNGAASIDNITVFPGEGNDRLRFVGAKFITDGSTQGFTAGLNFPYLKPTLDFIFPAGPMGLLDFLDATQLLLVAQPFYQRGFQLAFHANGDRAFDVTAMAVRMLGPQVSSRRTRIEHFTVHNNAELASQVAVCRELGLYPGLTIGHVFYWGKVFKERILGPEVAQNIDPTRPLLDAGVKVSLHSDSPITPSTPLLFVQTAVTRKYQAPPGGTPEVLGPQHRVTVLEALKCVTTYPAEAAYCEHSVGTLREGMEADLAVLGQDPTAVDPDQIAFIPVVQTRLAGRLVSGANP